MRENLNPGYDQHHYDFHSFSVSVSLSATSKFLCIHEMDDPTGIDRRLSPESPHIITFGDIARPAGLKNSYLRMVRKLIP